MELEMQRRLNKIGTSTAIGLMDCADKDLNKTSDVKREAMVSKLHNMQWLKSTLHSSNPGKARAVYKQMQEHNENSRTEDKVSFLTGNGQAHLAKESDTYCPIEKCKEHISGGIMSEGDKNMCNKDVDIAGLVPNIKEFVIHKNEEGNMLSSTENMVTTAKLEVEFCRNEESENANMAQNKTDNTVQKLEPQKATGRNAKKINSTKHSDDNNNSEFTTLSASGTDNKDKTICKPINVGSNGISLEEKDKDVRTKTWINESRTSIKNEEDATLSKNNEKPSTSDGKKPVSNWSKPTTPVKNAKIDRSNSKHTYARNIACIRREEFVKQRGVSRDRTENEKKDIAAKLKTDTEVEVNKTYDATPQSKSANKNKTQQKQPQAMISKQCTSKTKSQESFKKNTSVDDKDNTTRKTENGMNASKSFESTLNGSGKRDQETDDEKNYRNEQKANRGANVRRSATFVAQYKNSTFPKQANSTSNKIEYTTHGRNSSHMRNNSRSDRECADNVGRKIATRRDYTSVNLKFNRRPEEVCANNTENHAAQQKDVSTYNHKSDMDPTQTETKIIENKEPVDNSSVDHADQKPTTMEQPREGTEVTDESKADVNQDVSVVVTNKMVDKEINAPMYTLNNDKCITESQTDMMHQHLKLENAQHVDSMKQFETSQIWCNAPTSAMQKNYTTPSTIAAVATSSQQPVQGMHFGMQQIGAQPGDLPRQVSPWASDCGRYYEQHFATEELMRLGHVPNMAFDAIPYENLQTVPNDNDVSIPPSTLEIAIDRNRENSNVMYRYPPLHVHPRLIPSLSNFSGYSVSSGHGSRWSPALPENGGDIHMEHPAYNMTQQPMMQVYKSGTFGPEDFNAHATNCLPPHPIVYAPCMQGWNQIPYIPPFYNSPYNSPGYAVYPDMMNQASEFDDGSSMHGQQFKYVPHAQMNNYVRNGRGYDSNSCAAQARNTVDNVPVKSNQYYKRNYHDNCRSTYDVQRHVSPVSQHPRSQQGMNFMPTNANMNRRTTHYSQNPKYHRQSMNNAQMKKPHDQRIQDFVCDDNALEDIPPMISPKEFITSNMNALPSKNDQFAAQAFKPEFKMNPNADYRPPLWQRYNNNYRRNTTYQDFSRDNGSPVSIGRGTYKNKKP